ncbi:acylglycerol lipase [Martiniozyma asiatica (nom. inval.)]|nr:acylglycerol lipase [Martiniozyma asiatica]
MTPAMSAFKSHKDPFKPVNIEPTPGTIEIDDCIFKTYTWGVPDNVVRKGRIVYVHGYRDAHGGYHRHFEFFAQNGYDCFFYYQRGEGETKLVSGKKGVSDDYWALKGVDDMIQFNVKLLKGNEKLHLMGHSMGGGIVLHYAINGKFKDKISSFSTISPLVTLHDKTYPGFGIELIVRSVCLLPWGKTIRVKTPLMVEFLSGDKLIQQHIESSIDPANMDGAFVETRDFILRGRNLLKKETYKAIDKKTPLLIVHGDNDNINDYKGSVKFMDALVAEGLSDKEQDQQEGNKIIKIYEGGRHCLHIDKEDISWQMTEDLLEFINKYN